MRRHPTITWQYNPTNCMKRITKLNEMTYVQCSRWLHMNHLNETNVQLRIKFAYNKKNTTFSCPANTWIFLVKLLVENLIIEVQLGLKKFSCVQLANKHTNTLRELIQPYQKSIQWQNNCCSRRLNEIIYSKIIHSINYFATNSK